MHEKINAGSAIGNGHFFVGSNGRLSKKPFASPSPFPSIHFVSGLPIHLARLAVTYYWHVGSE